MNTPPTNTPELPPAPALPGPGDVVAGKYRIDGTLGVGGMGIVMAATDTSLGRPVAIKFLSRARADRPDAVLRFQREARAAASLQGENVVRILEVSQLPSGEPFIVMEYLRGKDLSLVVRERGGLPIAEATEYILQACEGLAEAHGRGIVHRDLKPQNLFRTEQPDGSALVKILDFGISKAVEDGTGTPDLTRTDTVLGTPLYMSPEQIRSLKNVDHRADVWALGIILFEMLTATPAFDAPSPSALCAMIVVDPPLRLCERRPGAPAELEGVILRCLEKDPARRYQDVAALAAALRDFTTDRGRLSADRVQRVLSSLPPRLGSGPTHPPAVDPSLAPTVYAGAPPQIGRPGGATDSVWTAGHPSVAPASRGGGGASLAGTIAVIVGAALTGVILLGAGAGALLYLRGRGAIEARGPTPAPAHSVAEPSRVTVTAADSAKPTATGSARVVTLAASATVPSPPSAPRTTPAASASGGAAKPGAQALVEKERKERKLLSDQNVQNSRVWGRSGDWRAAMAVCMSANRPDGTNAERAQCRLVCTKLDDNMCLMEMDGADRQWPSTM